MTSNSGDAHKEGNGSLSREGNSTEVAHSSTWKLSSWCDPIKIKTLVAQAFNSSIWEAGTGRFLLPGKPGLHSKIRFQKQKTKINTSKD